MNHAFTSLLVLALGSTASAASLQDPVSALPNEERVTLNLRDQELSSILEMFSNSYGLNLVFGAEVKGKVTLNLFDAPVRDALDRILAANGFRAIQEGGFLVVVPNAKGEGDQATQIATPFDPLVLRLNHIRAVDVQAMLTPMLSAGETLILGPSPEAEGLEKPGTGGNDQADREMLVLLASDHTAERILKLLEEIDTPPRQVLVEATILSVSLSDNSQMGVDFTALGGIDFQSMGGSTDVTDGVTGGSVDGAELEDWLLGFDSRGFADASSSGLHLGILRNQVGMFISALEDVGNATVLSNPQVLTLNRHSAQVLVGRKIGYQTTTTTQTTTTENVEFMEVGTSLTFRPFISDDGYVRLEIHPENSDGDINPITGLPDENTTEVSTNVLVRTGHTVVIGGLMETAVSTTTSQVPFLGNLPWIGNLFKSETQSEVRNEIIVMLTPHIVDDRMLSERADRVRARFEAAQAQITASHHGYLRPSYARRMYAEAGAALAEGDPELALARAEWGLAAMPANPDLATLAEHCAEELRHQSIEKEELESAVELLEQLEIE